MSKFSSPQISRYSRQLILPEFGVKGQEKLNDSSVLIVGAGGLGCPAAIYLAAAGVASIGILDYDDVELANLHRQILHTEKRVGTPKAASAALSCNELNSSIDCIPYHIKLSSENALQVIRQYDVVLDCTDNAPTRYLLNDACVLASKPLISGSALRFEGQLTIYNYNGGPCYRCIYPKPPPPETVTNCSDGGVIGVVPGLIGTYQALEAIKLLCGFPVAYSGQMLLFDGLSPSTPMRIIKLRDRQNDCAVCGSNPTVKELVNYESFCGTGATDKCKSLHLLPEEKRLTAQIYNEDFLKSNKKHTLIDVRPSHEFEICSLKSSINIPLSSLRIGDQLFGKLYDHIRNVVDRNSGNKSCTSYYVITLCRRGNNSQKAVLALQDILPLDLRSKLVITDIIGGITAWAKDVDPSFPVY